ncbi:MAG TPA: hypothetical protein VJ258_02415 [Candidatus Limnocylindrales bacterium]|nr:hypothetical protein [Candidatus Limnocylindrales bacterium]
MSDRSRGDGSPSPGDEGLQRVRPTTKARVRAGALPALAGLVIVVALGAAAVAFGLTRGPAARHPSDSPTANDYELTGRLSCNGQAPGAFTPGPDLFPSYFGCPMMAVPPQGYGAATWMLDRSAAFSPNATDLHILVGERACHGYERADGRIAQNVAYSDDAVVVTLAVRSLEGGMIVTCPFGPATPYTVHLNETVGNRALLDGGQWPPNAIVRGGQPVVSPTPTPYPSSWHQPMDCSPDVDAAGFFKAAAMGTAFDVYRAVLPKGWSVSSKSGDEQGAPLVVVTYGGPAGEVLTLQQGNICTKSVAGCMSGTEAGTAVFGDREGIFVDGPADADFAVYVDPGQNPSWIALGKGMSAETFKSLTSGLIVVGK